MRPNEAKPLLAQTEIFGQLDDSALDRLAEKAIERRFRRGPIFHQGDPGNSVFVLIEGLVKVMVTSEKGDEMVLVTLESPATFGELAVIDGLDRSATVEAVEPCRVLILGRDVLMDLVRQDRSFAEGLLRSLGGLIRRLTDQAADFVFLDLHGRVAKLLLAFADTRGEKTDDGTVLDLHLTQGDIARMVGGSRQSVNQIIRSFENRGYLEVQRKVVILKNLDLLARRAGL
ncbi:MAG: Crp/Fnr family transcriptional regulator [Actinomycetota bacterium]|nr:Crp/Fnr family transcriptional regulator [Actinomycetota bacterium]